MNFEVQNALCTLDKRTPTFFVAEMFSQGDLTSKKQASEALKNLDEMKTVKTLRARLSLY
jgi:hypothetical protein